MVQPSKAYKFHSVMPPRTHPPSKVIASILRTKRTPFRPSQASRQYATVTSTISSEEPPPIATRTIPIRPRYPKTQPPSFKPAEFRKTQLLRQYASLLRCSPMILIFQHNSLRTTEWIVVRRELARALLKVDEADAAASGNPSKNVASAVKLQIIQTGIFAAALRVVEFYRPENTTGEEGEEVLTHALSKAAHDAVVKKKKAHGLAPLLFGPLGVLTFPTVSPQHLKAALSILAPSPPLFPAPTRRANPAFHEAGVQNGLKKLMLLGARIEGRVLDGEGIRWVGSIDGGMDGLRAQLVHSLQGVGAGVTNTLESVAKGLYLTVEGRRVMLEDESKPSAKEEEAPQEP